MARKNPLLVPSTLPNQAPEFGKVKDTDFLPAIKVALKEARAQIRAIANNPDAPTFENTILAMETSGETLGTITEHLSNEVYASGSEVLVETQQKIEPLTARFHTSVSMNKKLFERVKAVHDNLAEISKLTAGQLTLLNDSYDGFRRSGAELKGAARKRMKEINIESSTLGTQFTENMKRANEKFVLFLDSADDLKGLPASNIESAAAEAAGRGSPGKYALTLEYPSYGPVLDYADDRTLRERIWRAVNTRAWKDEFDNQETIKRIVTLNHESAQLLGYKNHASYVLEDRMTENPETVMNFLKGLKDAYKPAAVEDLRRLQEFAIKNGGPEELKPWDIRYYGEKMKEAEYGFSKAELRDYFPLDKVLDGCFTHFSKQFGVKFTENKDYPTKSPDIRGFDVTDEKTGAFIGTLYTDFFPRKGKKDGAWMTEYRAQGLYRGQTERPVTAICCNFTKPVGNEQPCLDFEDEVVTLFHEMGHALDGLLQQVEFRSQAGYRRKWDAVELPSQIQEKWCFTKETLALISSHKVTGEPLPEELIEKLNRSKNFMAGYYGLRQVTMGVLDMAWYTTDPKEIQGKYGFDVFKFEEAVTADTRLMPMLAGPISTAFSHIFGGGYDAGYHGYAWADNLAADGYTFLTERKTYDTERLSKFRDEFIRHGAKAHPAVLYRNFRGQDPDPQALPRSQGLLTPKVA